VFRFDLPSAGRADVSVFDVSGRRIAGLFRGDLEAGSYEARWDRRSEDGARAPAGVYFVSLSVAGESARQRVIVVN